MSNRKESLKKSLGITEYPWSSDDDETETTPTAPEIQVMRRQRGEADISRSAAVDVPSTSAQPSTSSSNSQNATRRSQLFWSLSLSNPHRVSSISLPRTSSRLEMPLSLVSRERAGERGERAERGGERGRGSPAADVQRILAIRKLNRNLTMYRANRTAANLYAMQRSNSARTSRDSYRECFSTPSVALTTDVSALIKARSRNRNLPRQIPDPARNGPTLNEAVVGESAASSSAYSRRPAALGSAPSVEPVTLDHSDDDVELPPSTLSAPTIRSDINLEPDAPTEGGPHDVSGMSLEEEIVEIDMEPEPAAAGDAQPAEEGAPNEEPVANTSSASDEQQPHGVKRKRESVDDNNEPCSVREFNQSLLRLLECPVCLEWMEPPMSQCRRGHLVCTRCRARLAACPVCRTAFSSVRNRAMEGVAEMLRYPCRHGCGRDLRLRRRAAHEASCSARRYRCPAPACADRPPLPHADLPHHFQGKHLSMLKIGRKHKFSMKVNSEQHDNWVIMALHELFHLRVDVDIRTWGVVVYVAYIGPKCNATDYTYEVTVIGQHNSRKLVYTRATHCDLECSSLNVSRQDCFHLTLDQALNFLRVKNRHCEPDKFLNFNVEITKCENNENREDSDS